MWTAVFVGKSQLCPMGVVRDIIAACCETEFVVRFDLIYICLSGRSVRLIDPSFVFWRGVVSQNTPAETKLAWYTAKTYQKWYD